MTMTEDRPMNLTKRTRQTEYTTAEVLDLTGLSFRVLDYWLRTKVIVLADSNTPGSGHSRVYTPAEVAAIKRLAERYRVATSELASIRSGEAWAREVDAKVVSIR